jgi:hypothetical protein
MSNMWKVKVKFIQGSTKLSPQDHVGVGLSFWYKKASNVKKRKFLLHGTLKTLSKFTTQTSKSKKENQSFFSATILCFPDLFAADMLYLLLTQLLACFPCCWHDLLAADMLYLLLTCAGAPPPLPGKLLRLAEMGAYDSHNLRYASIKALLRLY